MCLESSSHRVAAATSYRPPWAWDFNGSLCARQSVKVMLQDAASKGKSSTTGNGRGPFLGARRSAKLAEKMAKSWRRNVIQKVVWPQTVWNPSRETSSLLHKPRTIGKATQRGSPINHASFLPRHRHGASTNPVVPAKVWKDGAETAPNASQWSWPTLPPLSPAPTPAVLLGDLGPWSLGPSTWGCAGRCSSSRFNRCVVDLGPQRFGPKL